MSHPKSIDIDGNTYPIDSQEDWADVITQIDKLNSEDRIMLRIPWTDGGHFVVQVSHNSRLSYLDPRPFERS